MYHNTSHNNKYSEEYDWHIVMEETSLDANEGWNPKMTGLDNINSYNLRCNQMTSEEVLEWLEEPSDQPTFEWYDQPD